MRDRGEPERFHCGFRVECGYIFLYFFFFSREKRIREDSRATFETRFFFFLFYLLRISDGTCIEIGDFRCWNAEGIHIFRYLCIILNLECDFSI